LQSSRYTGTLTPSDEGEVFWYPRKELSKLTLVSDFEDMLKVFESPEHSEFYYYKDGDKWGLSLL
jgi:8-oxo-dGTP diphosphatase